jgi:hypothetical protein
MEAAVGLSDVYEVARKILDALPSDDEGTISGEHQAATEGENAARNEGSSPNESVSSVFEHFLENEKAKASSPTKAKAHKNKKNRKWKKPAGKPKRPLSAYNLFFRLDRERIVKGLEEKKITEEDVAKISTETNDGQEKRVHSKSHGKIGFRDLSRVIGQRWKALDAETKTLFQQRAAAEKERYTKKLNDWSKTIDAAKEGQRSASKGKEQTIPKGSLGTMMVQPIPQLTMQNPMAPMMPHIPTTNMESAESLLEGNAKLRQELFRFRQLCTQQAILINQRQTDIHAPTAVFFGSTNMMGPHATGFNVLQAQKAPLTQHEQKKKSPPSEQERDSTADPFPPPFQPVDDSILKDFEDRSIEAWEDELEDALDVPEL